MEFVKKKKEEKKRPGSGSRSPTSADNLLLVSESPREHFLQQTTDEQIVFTSCRQNPQKFEA